MKMVFRILVGLLGLVVTFFAVKQVITGVRQIAGTSTQPQKLGETYTSSEGGYTHRIPQGWQSKPLSQPGVTMIVAPKESGYASNMSTTIQEWDGTLRAYADGNIEGVKSMFPDSKVLSDAEFSTESKATAYKIRFQNKAKEVDLVQTMYIFEGQRGKKIIVTCTTSARQAPELENLFDECMKTFALTQL